jgi:hypothetical protein
MVKKCLWISPDKHLLCEVGHGQALPLRRRGNIDGMTDADLTGSDKTEPPKKKLVLDLDSLTPEKLPVQTSLGTLYVGGHGFPSSVLKAGTDLEVGRTLVQHLCNRLEDKPDTTLLGDEDLAALSDEDIAMLGPVICKQQRWPDDVELNTLEGIAQAAKGAVEREHRAFREEVAKMQDSLKSGFSFLKQDTLRKLQDDMTGMSAFRKLTESATASSILSKNIRDLLKHQDDGLLGAMRKATAPDTLRQRPDGFPPSNLEPRINAPIAFPRPEESPLGRATLQNAENSQQTLELMRELTQRMAGVQETLVGEVLPQWFAQVEREQRKANEDNAEAAKNTKNAAASLRWAKWAIFASIIATAAATWWQVRVAQEIDRGTTAQLQRAEKVLQEQLAAQQQALEQRRAESDKLLELLQLALKQPQKRKATAPRGK